MPSNPLLSSGCRALCCHKNQSPSQEEHFSSSQQHEHYQFLAPLQQPTSTSAPQNLNPGLGSYSGCVKLGLGNNQMRLKLLQRKMMDLKHAYFHIQIAPHHRPFLRFTFKGMAYQYTFCPHCLWHHTHLPREWMRPSPPVTEGSAHP